MPADSKQRDVTPITKATLQVLAGGSAGFVEVCLMQPLDVVKTRMQLGGVTHQYNGVVDCFGQMYRNEGFSSFWKGIFPPLLAETPKRATKFVIFEQTKPLFMFGAAQPTPVTFSLAGLTAGITEAVLVNPFEVIKVTQQADKRALKDAISTWAVTKRVLVNEGFGSQGLYKGLTATISRNGAFNTVYFGFYHSVKNYVPACERKTMEFLRKACIGFLSGTLACFINTPFDVVKSRIQGPQTQSQTGLFKYKSTFKSIAIIYHEEGFKALYKGLVPKIMRLGPGGAIMLIVFEYAYDFMEKKFC